MRHVILVRHAKSSWDDAFMSDFDRPLTERGKEDALLMAKHVFEKKVQIDSFISSPAKRARKTASFFLKQYGLEKEDLVLKPELYLPPVEIFYSTIEACNDDIKNLALFSHNSGITDFANTLVSTIKVPDIPTCGVFVIQTNASSWQQFRDFDKRLVFFDYPSKIR